MGAHAGRGQALHRQEQRERLPHRRHRPAAKAGMGKRTNTVLQSAFFALANIPCLPRMPPPVHEGRRHQVLHEEGPAIVDANHKAIDAGATAFQRSRFCRLGHCRGQAVHALHRGPRRHRRAGQEPPRAHQPHGRRLAARLRVREARRRPVGARRLSVREARRCRNMVPHWDETKRIQWQPVLMSARTPRFARLPSWLTRLPRLLRTCA